MFKNIDRVGCDPVRFIFSIRVIDLILPNLDPPLLSNDSLLSICFERGAKISSTSNKVRFLQKEIIVLFIIFIFFKRFSVTIMLVIEVPQFTIWTERRKIALKVKLFCHLMKSWN